MDVLQSPRIDADGIADAAAVIDCGLNLGSLGILGAARQRALPGASLCYFPNTWLLWVIMFNRMFESQTQF
jgi:hypothetical protein